MARSPNMFAAPAKPKVDRLLISAEEAAPMLGVSPRHLRAMARDGKVPHVLIGERIMFSPERLRQWIDEQSTISVRVSA